MKTISHVRIIELIAEPKGEATNRDALSFRVCIYHIISYNYLSAPCATAH